MSLDVWLTALKPTEVYSANITHNLGKMAETAGLERLKAEPAKFKIFNASNGWGKYENLVAFVERYLDACKEYPEAAIGVSR